MTRPATHGSAAVKHRISRAKAERLQRIADQVASGELVIRQATAGERERYGIRPQVEEASDGD